MAIPSATKTMCDWICSTGFQDIPREVRQFAVLAIYDGIGGNLACSLLPAAHRMADFVKIASGLPECSLIGFPTRTSASNAALLNGTLGHADEVDAGEADRAAGAGHILAPVLAAALAAGQIARMHGQEVVRAVVMGHELSKRIFRVAGRVEQETGRTFAAIDTGKTMGAAVAAGIGLGLRRDQMEICLGLAAYMAGSVRSADQGTEHMIAALEGGMGAKSGVTAALMARAGFDAPRNIFDGAQGFFHSLLGVNESTPEFLQDLGKDYSIKGLIFKRHSGARLIQVLRQGILDLMSENGLTADDIAEIVGELDPKGFENVTRAEHPTESGREALALAAIYGGTGFRESHLEAVWKSPEVEMMRKRIKVQARQDWTAEDKRFSAMVTLMTKNGSIFRKESTYKRMTEDELDAKFYDLVGLRAGRQKAKELASALKQMEKVTNVADVIVQMEIPERSIEQV